MLKENMNQQLQDELNTTQRLLAETDKLIKLFGTILIWFAIATSLVGILLILLITRRI